jgi:crossover junction endodeoxyribonuclease RusA
MTELQFEVRGLPVPQGSAKAFPNPKTGGSIVVTQTPKLKAWREAVANEARKVAPQELIDGGVKVRILFLFPLPKSKKEGCIMITRPDIDKLIRAVFDACTGVIWTDDSRVDCVLAEKRYGLLPGVKVAVRW